MLATETIEMIQLANDFNAKLFLLVVLAMYAGFAFWKYNKVESDSLSNKIYKLFLFIYSRITLFFYPLMAVTFLHINTTLDEMITIISTFYGIIFVVTFCFLIMLGMEKVLELLGIEKGGMVK